MTQKKTITATIVMEELLYDIMSETYLKKQSIDDETNYKKAAALFASMDEWNQDKIMRSVKMGFSEVKAGLSEYLEETGTTPNSGQISPSENLVLILKMPGNFDEAASDCIAESVHDYLRNKAVSEWYLITNKEDAADYSKLAAQSFENIRRSVGKRRRPMR